MKKTTIGIVLFFIPFFASAGYFTIQESTDHISEGPSGYLNDGSNYIRQYPDLGGSPYVHLITPLGTTCTWNTGTYGDSDGSGFGIGIGVDLTPYWTGTGCDVVDYSEDGPWTINVYTDGTYTSLTDTFFFTQGAEPPPGPMPTSSIEQILTQIHYDFIWFLFLLALICGFLWHERYYKR